MKLTKFLHSCILVEEGSSRILIDPGEFSFIEKKLKPEDIPEPHAVLISHKHPDHFSPEALKVITKNGAKIYGNPEVAAQAKAAGFIAQEVVPGQSLSVGQLSIKVIAGEHGEIPTEIPMNTGFFINEHVFHPGDSITSEIGQVNILLLPVSATWQRLVDALRFAQKLKPRLAIPIHDAFIKDFFLRTMYERLCEPYLKKSGIEFKPLGLGEGITL